MIDKFRGAFLERESELLQKEKSSVFFCPVFLRKENCNFQLNLACIFFFWNESRVRGSPQYWKALWGATFFLEDQVKLLVFTSASKAYFLTFIFYYPILIMWRVWTWIIAGIVTRRPLVLQLHRTEEGSQEYAEFLHLSRRKFTDFCM